MVFRQFISLLLVAHFFESCHCQPSCANFTKNDFGPTNIIDKDICRTACEKAEGWCCPDFKMSTDVNGTVGYKCDCVSCDSCDNKKYRSLCVDETYSSSYKLGHSKIFMASIGFLVGGTSFLLSSL